MGRAAFRACGVVVAAALLQGCTVARETPDEFQFDSGPIGEIAPGTRGWWGYLQAMRHCDQYGKDSRLVDLRGSIAVYRCVDRPKN